MIFNAFLMEVVIKVGIIFYHVAVPILSTKRKLLPKK